MTKSEFTIPLTKGFETIVDADLYLSLRDYKWFAVETEYFVYAARRESLLGKQIIVYMHRQILGLYRGDGVQIAHVDGDSLNNQRSNLQPRVASPKEKRCKGCQKILPLSKDHFYYISARRRWSSRCLVCFSRPARRRVRQQATKRSRYATLRTTVIKAYGGHCNCCGETIAAFLTIDHVNGGGEIERCQGLTGVRLFRHIIKAGFPKKYQILCYNCNCAKGNLGKCPHKSSRPK